MQIHTRVILTPRGGGEPLEIFDSPEGPSAEADTVLASYTARFGEPIETAWTEAEGVEGPISLGWVFQVPESFELPGPPEEFEMVLIPMLEAEGSLVSLFVSLAQQRARAEELLASGAVDTLHLATLAQRDPGDTPEISGVETRHRSAP